MLFGSTKVPASYCLVDSPRLLSWLVESLAGAQEFAYDIETNHPTGKRGGKSKLPEGFVERVAGISFAWGRQGVTWPWTPGTAAYLPLIRQDDSPFWRDQQASVLTQVKTILESDTPKVAQYGKFDVFKLARLLDIRVKNFNFDVCLAHSLIDEERLKSSHALKSEVNSKGEVTKLGMADVYLMQGSSDQKDDLESALDHYDSVYRRYSKVPLNILYPYGCADSDYALSLKYVFLPLLEAEGLMWLFENITMKLQHELTLMELHGVPLDLERAKQVEVEQLAVQEQCKAEAYQIVGRTFDLGSPSQVGKLLFEDLGIAGGRRGKTSWTTDSDVLESIEHPVVSPILKFRRAQKIQGTYATAFLKEVDEVTNDGRVGWMHMTYYPDTVTGRLRGSDPSLLTLPRPENGGDIVKSMLAGGSDYRFIFKDYSQIEMRFLAHCSCEPVWIEGFRNGYDLHSAMAQRIWHPELSIDDVKKLYPQDRSNAKAVNFGIAYGESVWALAENLGISYDEADKLVNVDYFGAAPTLKAWIDTVQADAVRDGFVYNIWGRRRHLPDAQIPIPVGDPWPADEDRPGCYRQGPSIAVIGMSCQDLRALQPAQFSGCVQKIAAVLGNSKYLACRNCNILRSCMINTEVKRVKGVVGGALRQAINSPIQGGAADMVNLALIMINQELRNQRLDAAMIVNIHDELCVYSHTSCVEVVCRIMDYYMCEYMEKLTQLRVPITTDMAVVYRWSEKHLKE